MPDRPTYPGVYIEEVPSGAQRIEGVPTSITAFVGRAMKGTLDDPIDCHSWDDFERSCGGLWDDGPMTYAVRDFFGNGGTHAKIVRIALDAETATVNIDGKFDINADSPGTWGNHLKAQITHPGLEFQKELEKKYGFWSQDEIDDPSTDVKGYFFDLAVYSTASGEEQLLESVSGVTLQDCPRRIDIVLESSQYVAIDTDTFTVGAERPVETEKLELAGGSDGDHVVDGAGNSKDPHVLPGSEGDQTGIYALERADTFNLLCIPPDEHLGADTPADVYQKALEYCAKKRAMLIVDPPAAWGASAAPVTAAKNGFMDLGLTGDAARNAALYFPRVRQTDPLDGGAIKTVVPCGHIAGLFARTDTERGVWKAAAGINASMTGVAELDVELTDEGNGILNPLGVNCLRTLPTHGHVVWGSRTLRGADAFADEYKYIPVRRTALYIEESLYRGLQWVIFEPNDEPLWSKIRGAVGAFMNGLFRQGAFQGAKASEAYFVQCDGSMITELDREQGVVRVTVGFAPLKPAEFVVLHVRMTATD